MHDFFVKYASRMRLLKRFAIRETIMPQNVAEHSWMVAMLALSISTKHNISCTTDNFIDVGEVLSYALCHDIAETVTSDIPYFIKNFDDQSKTVFNCIDNSAIEVIAGSFGGAEHVRFMSTLFRGKFEDFSPGIIELVELCDCIEILYYVLQESLSGNNHSWIHEVHNGVLKLSKAKLSQLVHRFGDNIVVIVSDILKHFESIDSKYQSSSDIIGGTYDKQADKINKE